MSFQKKLDGDPPAALSTVPLRAGRGLRGLVALNGALLLLLGAVTFGPVAEAQVRARGAYVMAAGGVKGSNADGVFIVDVVNQELVAITFDPDRKELVGIGFRNIVRDKADMGQGRDR